MKKAVLSMLLLSTLGLFQGCGNPLKAETKHYNLVFEKRKDATLFYYKPKGNYDDEKNMLINILGDDYITDENGKKKYIPRLGLHFKDNRSYDKGYGKQIRRAYIIPCDSKKEYSYVDLVNKTSDDAELIDYPISVTNDANYSVYFRIDQMREHGYIAKDRTKQKDLCILSKWYEYRSGGKTGGSYRYYKSNRLKFTAEEISNVVQEYDEAGFSKYDGTY